MLFEFLQFLHFHLAPLLRPKSELYIPVVMSPGFICSVTFSWSFPVFITLMVWNYTGQKYFIQIFLRNYDLSDIVSEWGYEFLGRNTIEVMPFLSYHIRSTWHSHDVIDNINQYIYRILHYKITIFFPFYTLFFGGSH